jgi:ketol-acid reductoisomerase
LTAWCELGIEPAYAAKLVQYGWETVTEGLKQGGITNMMDRLSNPAKIRAFDLAEEMKGILRPLFEKHQDDIMSGHFSSTMMADWAANDTNLLNGAPKPTVRLLSCKTLLMTPSTSRPTTIRAS